MTRLLANIKVVFFLYLVLLLLLHLLPINGKESALNNNYTIGIRWDYIGHFLAFGFLSFVGNVFSATKKYSILTTNLLLLLLAASLEGLQYILPYRAFNLNDLLANGIGIGLGGVVFVFIKTRKSLA